MAKNSVTVSDAFHDFSWRRKRGPEYVGHRFTPCPYHGGNPGMGEEARPGEGQGRARQYQGQEQRQMKEGGGYLTRRPPLAITADTDETVEIKTQAAPDRILCSQRIVFYKKQCILLVISD